MVRNVRSCRRIVVLALLLCFIGILPAGALETVAATQTRSNGSPYYIMVNRKMNTVTVYGLDANGYYTVPVRAMICSTGRQGHATPLGTFSVTSVKKKWCYMVDHTYGQYSTQFYGNYLFHSVCYKKPDPSTLITEEYNLLGGPASRGCVRLQTVDAKWIYENCGPGTKVTVYEGESAGALGKPERLVDHISPQMENGWDPTDPQENNPWHAKIIRDFDLHEPELTLEAGIKKALSLRIEPLGASFPAIEWQSSNPAVAIVDARGYVTGLSEGACIITATCREVTKACLVKVRGELLPYRDVEPGSWYYEDIRYVWGNRLAFGAEKERFSPEAGFTHADMLRLLYDMAGEPDGQADTSEAAVTLSWALRNRFLLGVPAWSRPITRQDMVELLYRYETSYLGKRATGLAELSRFADHAEVDDYARTAMRWAVGKGLIFGSSEQLLQPKEVLTRAQAAVLVHRYHAALV